jgi:hypothetical protein
MTMTAGIFCCGNALLVNDLVDYVSESGETAGRNAASLAAALPGDAEERRFADIAAAPDFLCISPQRLDLGSLQAETPVFFRVREERNQTLVRAVKGDRELFRRSYRRLRPPEMERILLPTGDAELREGDRISFTMEEL